MVAIFAICGQMNAGIIYGALLGCVFAFLNFVLLARDVEKVLEMEDKKKAENYMQGRQMIRMLMLAVMVVVAIKIEAINHWSAIIPLFFQRFLVYAIKFYDKKKGAM
jgi:dipeptide/tripeptide permease